MKDKETFQLFSTDGKQRITFNESENTARVAFQNDDGTNFSDWRKCTYVQKETVVILTYVSKKGRTENKCTYDIELLGEGKFSTNVDWYEE